MKHSHFPTRCINCGSRDFDTEFDHDETDVVELCTCCDCTFQWVRIYEFVEWRDA